MLAISGYPMNVCHPNNHRFILTEYEPILTEYDKLFAQFHANHQIHVENIQEHNFLRINKSVLDDVPLILGPAKVQCGSDRRVVCSIIHVDMIMI